MHPQQVCPSGRRHARPAVFTLLALAMIAFAFLAHMPLLANAHSTFSDDVDVDGSSDSGMISPRDAAAFSPSTAVEVAAISSQTTAAAGLSTKGESTCTMRANAWFSIENNFCAAGVIACTYASYTRLTTACNNIITHY